MTKPNSKKHQSVKKPAKKRALYKKIGLKRSIAFTVMGALSLFSIASLLPESSPLSFNSLRGVGTDRIAPEIDKLEGNFSVAGEAASTSLLVKYKKSIPPDVRERVNKKIGGKAEKNINRLGVDVVNVSSNDSVGETVRKYKSRSEVEYAEPNYLAKRFLAPNDSLYSKQWHLEKIKAPKAWDVSQGGYGPIAVIDTGVMSSQSDLSGQVLSGYNFVSDNTDTKDDNGHGTHVAGIISATTNNANGVASIGYKGSILPVKVLDATGSGTYAGVADGIIYAADKGARIINMSLGGPNSSRTLMDAVKYAQSKGSVVVAAMGNNGNDALVYPAAYPGVVAVSASDQNDNLASFSSFGEHVFISAPGVSVISTYNSGGYATLSGTSMAAPVVSGLIGLALATGSTSPGQVLNDIKASSDKVGPYAYDESGWNRYMGYGRINAAKLLGSAAVDETTEKPVEDISQEEDPAEVVKIPPGRSKEKSRGSRVQFTTVMNGMLDSLKSDGTVMVVKVQSSNENLKLNAGNLIDLYILPSTVIKTGNTEIPSTSVPSGAKLSIKAEWKDNRLNAQEIKVTSKKPLKNNPKTRR